MQIIIANYNLFVFYKQFIDYCVVQKQHNTTPPPPPITTNYLFTKYKQFANLQMFAFALNAQCKCKQFANCKLFVFRKQTIFVNARTTSNCNSTIVNLKNKQTKNQPNNNKKLYKTKQNTRTPQTNKR